MNLYPLWDDALAYAAAKMRREKAIIDSRREQKKDWAVSRNANVDGLHTSSQKRTDKKNHG